MHLNIKPQYHFEELSELLQKVNTEFSVIGLTDSRLKITSST